MPPKIELDDFYIAYRKLKSMVYYDSGGLDMKLKIAEFEHSLMEDADSGESFRLTSYLIEKGKLKHSEFLTSSSFWIYASHALILSIIIKAMFMALKAQTDMAMLSIYLLAPLITILIGLAMFWILKKYLPRFTAVITGGR